MNVLFKSADEYFMSQPEAAQMVLEKVRRAIRRAVPEAEEVISYHMPTYKLHGSAMLYLAGWKQHYSLYPASAHLAAAFQNELAPYTVNKGTVRFPLSAPVPVKLIERIARFRAQETLDRASVKAAQGKKRAVPRTGGSGSRARAG